MSDSYHRWLQLKTLFEKGRIRIIPSFEHIFGQRPSSDYSTGVTIEGEYEVVTEKKALPEAEGK